MGPQQPLPTPSIQMSVTVAWIGGAWQALVQRQDRPETRIFHSAEDLAAYLKGCRPTGLQ